LHIDTSKTEQHVFAPTYTLEVEYFSEDEVEEQLARLLSAYRALYLDPDEAEPPRSRDPASGKRSRRALKAIFKKRLRSARDEELLLQGEEEDVLDMLFGWIRGMELPSGGLCRETFAYRTDCTNRLCALASELCVKEIR
jgi:hypothetical protein